MHVSFPKVAGRDVPAQISTRGPGIAPRRCWRRMEDEIGKDNSDTGADKFQERQDHFMAQQVEQKERVGYPREEDVIEPENVDENMNCAVDEEELTDAPATKSDVRLKSPERKKATKRSTARHEEEPSTKMITIEDTAVEEHDGIDVDSMAART